MTILARLPFGSHMYGTNVEGSDVDTRSIYLPSVSDCLLNRVRHSFKATDEQDGHYFSLNEFLSLASQGQSVAIELLACSTPVQSSPTWDYLRANRKRFFTKRIHSFAGYAKAMSGKYSARVDRLKETEAILACLVRFDPSVHGHFAFDGIWDMEKYYDDHRLSHFWDQLPESLNAVKTTNDRNTGAEKRVYLVCGREIQATVTVRHAYDVIHAIYASYGERVRAVREGRVEWKSVGHAFRAALQAKEIVETGDLVFPLKDAAWLRDLRLGRIDFVTNELDKRLDDLIAEVQGKMDASDLAESVSQEWLDEIVLDAYARADLRDFAEYGAKKAVYHMLSIPPKK